MSHTDSRDLVIEALAGSEVALPVVDSTSLASLSPANDLIVGLLRTLRQRDEHTAVVRKMLSVGMAMLVERDAALKSQRQQSNSLREEIRRYTASAVGGRS